MLHVCHSVGCNRKGFPPHPRTHTENWILDIIQVSPEMSDRVRSGLMSLKHCVVMAWLCSIQLSVDPHQAPCLSRWGPPPPAWCCHHLASLKRWNRWWDYQKILSDQIILSVLQVLFTISGWAFRCLLHRRGFLSAIRTRWWTYWTFYHLHTGSLKLSQNGHWLLGHIIKNRSPMDK